VPPTDKEDLTFMSYDLMLSGSHRSESPVRRKNPLTGQDVEFYSHTLNEIELRDAKSVLSRYGATDAGDRRQVVQLPDGVRLEVTVGSKEDGERGAWSLQFRTFSKDATKFLFELASAGNFNVASDDVSVATSAAVKERLKETEPACVVAGSAEEMGVLLKDGFKAWQAYAKQVKGE
jgi:hypothetical protein